MVAQPDTNINYIRNSVKAVVDAYDGSVKLYAWDENDPVLKTWEKAFPGTCAAEERDLRRPAGAPALPAGHVQGAAPASWPATTMTDPDTWYRQSGLWEVPNDPVGGANSTAKESPFYLSVKWPRTTTRSSP